MDQNNTAAVMRTLRHVLIRKGLASLLREKPDANEMTDVDHASQTELVQNLVKVRIYYRFYS